MELENTEVNESIESTQEGSQTAEQPSQIFDLDSAEKVKFEGREWTRDELKSAYMMQSDYTKKTTALAEERKYYDNLWHDVEKVKANPSLIDQFKSVYPQSFHKALEYLDLKTAAQPQAQPQQPQNVNQDLMKRFEAIENDFKENKVKAINAELDAKFDSLSKKYTLADEEAVLARAQSMLDKGTKLTDQVWDQLWKSVHDRNQQIADKYYQSKVKQQSEANAKGKDIASGGGIPGNAPVKARSIKEATEMLFKSGGLEN